MEATKAVDEALACLVRIMASDASPRELKLEAAKVILNRPRHFISGDDPNAEER
jgi:hypothetical protein